MPQYQNISYVVKNNVARIALERPKYRNAQSRVLLEELDDAFATAADALEVHAIVLLVCCPAYCFASPGRSNSHNTRWSGKPVSG